MEKTDKQNGNIDPRLNIDENNFLDFLESNLYPEISPDLILQRLSFGTAAGAG